MMPIQKVGLFVLTLILSGSVQSESAALYVHLKKSLPGSHHKRTKTIDQAIAVPNPQSIDTILPNNERVVAGDEKKNEFYILAENEPDPVKPVTPSIVPERQIGKVDRPQSFWHFAGLPSVDYIMSQIARKVAGVQHPGKSDAAKTPAAPAPTSAPRPEKNGEVADIKVVMVEKAYEETPEQPVAASAAKLTQRAEKSLAEQSRAHTQKQLAKAVQVADNSEETANPLAITTDVLPPPGALKTLPVLAGAEAVTPLPGASKNELRKSKQRANIHRHAMKSHEAVKSKQMKVKKQTTFIVKHTSSKQAKKIAKQTSPSQQAVIASHHPSSDKHHKIAKRNAVSKPIAGVSPHQSAHRQQMAAKRQIASSQAVIASHHPSSDKHHKIAKRSAVSKPIARVSPRQSAHRQQAAAKRQIASSVKVKMKHEVKHKPTAVVTAREHAPRTKSHAFKTPSAKTTRVTREAAKGQVAKFKKVSAAHHPKTNPPHHRAMIQTAGRQGTKQSHKVTSSSRIHVSQPSRVAMIRPHDVLMRTIARPGS